MTSWDDREVAMGQGKAISLDLRERAVDAYENGEGTYQEIADRFCIGRTTLCDMVRMSRYANTLEPITIGALASPGRSMMPARSDSALWSMPGPTRQRTS
jgi:hypothetical protein